jgi:hypothetical protein
MNIHGSEIWTNSETQSRLTHSELIWIWRKGTSAEITMELLVRPDQPINKWKKTSNKFQLNRKAETHALRGRELIWIWRKGKRHGSCWWGSINRVNKQVRKTQTNLNKFQQKRGNEDSTSKSKAWEREGTRIVPRKAKHEMSGRGSRRVAIYIGSRARFVRCPPMGRLHQLGLHRTTFMPRHMPCQSGNWLLQTSNLQTLIAT